MEFKLALDWTPNINHIGFFVGKEKNFFKDYGIELLINSPERDNYKYSPAKQIELGISDFGLTPTESVISFRTKNNPFKLTAVAALFKVILVQLLSLMILESRGQKIWTESHMRPMEQGMKI